jgi:uncharacterized protein (TIGR03435 family)
MKPPRHSLSLVIVVLSAHPAAPRAQQLSFEVASIRPVQLGGQEISVGLRTQGDQVRVGAYTFREYVAIAYRVRPYQVAGPDWITEDRFDLQAKLPAGGTADQVPQMLQRLLDDRFGLKMHRDKREMAVHALVRGSNTPRLKENPFPDGVPSAAAPPNVAVSGTAAGVAGNYGNGTTYAFASTGRFEATRMTMALLAGTLERMGDRPIVDLTGLKSAYDFSFDVGQQNYQPLMIRSAVNAGVPIAPQARTFMESAGNPLIDAVEQIGLKLEPRREPIDVIVVDEARRTPIEN